LRGFSDDRRFFVPVLVLFVFSIFFAFSVFSVLSVFFVFFVLVIIIVGISRRHCVAHDGDEAPVDQPSGNIVEDAWGHVGSCLALRHY
jgi:hypothetical protein